MFVDDFMTCGDALQYLVDLHDEMSWEILKSGHASQMPALRKTFDYVKKRLAELSQANQYAYYLQKCLEMPCIKN